MITIVKSVCNILFIILSHNIYMKIFFFSSKYLFVFYLLSAPYQVVRLAQKIVGSITGMSFLFEG